MPTPANFCDFACSFLRNYVIMIKIQRRQPYVVDVLQARIGKQKPGMICIAPSILELPAAPSKEARPVWRHAPRRRGSLSAVLVRYSGCAEGRRSAVSIVSGICRPRFRQRGGDAGCARPRAGAGLLCPARPDARRRGAQCRGDGACLLRRHPGREEAFTPPMLATACLMTGYWQRLGQALHAVLQDGENVFIIARSSQLNPPVRCRSALRRTRGLSR